MSLRSQRTPHMMGAAARFHCNHAWWKHGSKADHRLTAHSTPNDDTARLVQANDAAAVLA
jgi:hypothetical protein